MDAQPGEPRDTSAGRYVICDQLASGGMATVYIGRLVGPAGFSRTVAIKRLHSFLAVDPDFAAMLLDEARLAARIRHPNVVPTLDVVRADGELFLVMDYVEGESLARLARLQKTPLPLSIAATIVAGALEGLHAAHEAMNDRGEPLSIVHRDVSPQNILVGSDGVPRLVDFGVAKAVGRVQSTREGHVKGKAGYMPPEQLRGETVDRRADVYASAVVLWELLTGKRLFAADSPAATMMLVLEQAVLPPSHFNPEVREALDGIVMRGLAHDAELRYSTAEQMAQALEQAVPPATARQIAQWVTGLAAESLRERAKLVARAEATPTTSGDEPSLPISGIAPRSRLQGAIEAPSQVSTISVSSPARARAAGRGSPAIVVGAAAIAVLSAAVAVAAWWTRAPRALDNAPVAASSVATPSAPAPATEDVVPVALDASTSSAPATATVARPRDRPPRARPSPRPSAACTPPYTLDSKGIHIPKPECL